MARNEEEFGREVAAEGALLNAGWLLAFTALSPVLADASAAALLAIVALPPMLADAGAAALFA